MVAASLSALGLVLAASCSPATHALGQLRAPATHDTFRSLIADSRDLGPVAASTTIELVLELEDRHAGQRLADLEATYRPGSPTYGQLRTPEQLAARYGPSPDAVSSVIGELRVAGLRASWEPGNTWVGVAGPASAVDETFHVSIHNYESRGGIKFIASAQDPRVPPRLSRVVIGTRHLSNYPWVHVDAAPEAGLTPTDFSLAYDIKPLRDQNIDGTGETVAVWALGDGYRLDELTKWSEDHQLPPMKITHMGGPQDAPLGVGELMLDLEVIHAIAPGATLAVYTNQYSGPEWRASELLTLTALVKENENAVVNLSFGGCEGEDDPSYRKVFEDAAMLHESVFASSGDSGAYECMLKGNTPPPTQDDIGISCPACFASVTAVGGTRLSVRSDKSWYNEVVWEWPAEMEGTGGGVSRFQAMPDYQKQGFVRSNAGTRQVPDVSAAADPASGLAIYLNGRPQRGGGTSQSAPIWAAITALTNQYLKRAGHKPIGMMNPALYAVAANQIYPAFHDVTVGDNLEYSAGPGYDLVTGLGTPDVWNLVRDLEAYQRKAGA